MKKSLIILLSAGIMSMGACLTGCSCACTVKHTHTFSSKWEYDAENHWHAATCKHTNEKDKVEKHDFDRLGKCKVCGYQKPALLKMNESNGKTKEEAILKTQNEYFYTDGVLSEEKIYRYKSSTEQMELSEHIFYAKHTVLEEDYEIYNYNGDKVNDIEHYVEKYDEMGALIYEKRESKYKEEDPYQISVEEEYIIDYNEEGKVTSNVHHFMKSDFWDKKTSTYDELGRLTECVEFTSYGEVPEYEPTEKTSYTYVDNTQLIATCSRFSYKNNEFALFLVSKYSYNDSMMLTKIEEFDENNENYGLTEIAYEGNKVTKTEKNWNSSKEEFSLDEITISEFASEYVEGMTNPIKVTCEMYDYGSPEDKEVYTYTYNSVGEVTFVEEVWLEPTQEEWEVYRYTTTEYIYEE